MQKGCVFWRWESSYEKYLIEHGFLPAPPGRQIGNQVEHGFLPEAEKRSDAKDRSTAKIDLDRSLLIQIVKTMQIVVALLVGICVMCVMVVLKM